MELPTNITFTLKKQGNSSSSHLIDIFRWTEQFGFLNIAYILLIMTSLFGNCA